MASKTTQKATGSKTSRNSSRQSQKKHSLKKPDRINRQRRLQKQLQALLLERHSRRCIICHHPEREAIEEESLPAQPAAPPKPKPDADGRIWHKRPGYPDQEMSEPDAQGRVMYKIHMTTAASQLPSRETDAQRSAKLIYRSVIKKYGNP